MGDKQMTELQKNDYGETDNATSLFNSGEYDIEKSMKKLDGFIP